MPSHAETIFAGVMDRPWLSNPEGDDMLFCRRCAKPVSGDSKICRDCGGILDNISQQETPRAPDPPTERAGAELPELVELPGPKRTGDPLPIPPASARTRATSGDGEKADQGELELLDRIANAPDADQDPEPTHLYAEALGVAQDEEAPSPPRTGCPHCGSSRVMHGVALASPVEHSDAQVRAVVYGDPSALVFKDRAYGALRADICGDCGHVELRVSNAKELYRHYRKSH